MKEKFILGIGIILSVLSMPAAADNHTAKRMHVQIGNNTGTSCFLSEYKIVHGKLDSAAPQSIVAGDSKSFDMYQAGFGPDVILAYQCAIKNIRFEVSQSQVIVTGSKPKVKIISAGGIQLHSESISSSTFWGKPGIINITLY